MDNGLSGWSFGDFCYTAARGLERDGFAIELQPKMRALLELLLQARGGLVSKEAIAAALWPSEAASDDSISRLAHLLRRAMRDDSGKLVRTIYGAGLRLDAAIVPPANVGRSGGQEDLVRTVYEIVATRTAEALNRGREALRLSLAHAPHNAAAWTLLADLTAALAFRGSLAPKRAAADIGDAVARALAVAPRHPGALAVSGWSTAMLAGRHAEGRRSLNEALARDPGAWISFYYRAWLHAHAHDFAAALDDLNASVALSPLDKASLSFRAYVSMCAGLTNEGASMARNALRLRPDADVLWYTQCIAAGLRGDFSAAITAVERAQALVGQERMTLSMLSWAYAIAGRTAQARSVYDSADHGAYRSAFFAPALFALGDRRGAKAFALAARADGCPWRGIIWADPRLAGLRAR